MPSALRSRIALIALLGAFLIPLGTSSLRGLTHVLTCREEAEVPFTIVTPEDGGVSTVASSNVLNRDDTEGVCGGLVLNPGVGQASSSGRVRLLLPITNNTDDDWRGTVRLRVGSTVVPVDIGEIEAGETATTSVDVRIDPGQLEVNGSLLIGP